MAGLIVIDVEHLHVYSCVDAGNERNLEKPLCKCLNLTVSKTHKSIEAAHLYAQACVDDKDDVDDVGYGGVVGNAQD